MIKAVIFDVDGLLIDSEPLWREAMVKVLGDHGVLFTTEQCVETMGMRIDEVVKYWFEKLKIKDADPEKVTNEIIETVISLIKSKGQILPGAHEIMDLIASQGLPIALASSYPMNLINAVVEKIAIKDKINLICSAENEPFGKPHPGIYITTAGKLGITPEFCLAFEDSPNGVLSAKSAKMKCVAVPEHSMKDDKKYGIADLMLPSLKDFTVEHLKNLSA